MANAIDLCQVDDVRSLLNISSAQDAAVNTTVTTSITAGLDRVVHPVSIVGISDGSILLVTGSTGSREYIIVKTADRMSGDIIADFNVSHVSVVTLQDVTDMMLARMITVNSVAFMRKTGRLAADGTVPAKSVFNEPVDFDQWYDGNGNNRLFLREWPITQVTQLVINGSVAQLSDDPRVPGYVIDSSGKCLAMRGGCASGGLYSSRQTSLTFSRGIQNIRVVYKAGWASTPADVQDACIEMVALQYRRRNWIDQKSIGHTDGSGSVTYRDWEISPKIQEVINDYKRRVA